VVQWVHICLVLLNGKGKEVEMGGLTVTNIIDSQ
jgi:hypothetical protein